MLSFRLMGSEAAVRDFLERVSEKTNLVVYLKDAAGRYLYVNPGFEGVASMRRDRILGRTDAELFPPDVAKEFRAQDAEVVRHRAAVEFEETLALPTGIRSFHTEKIPLMDRKGHICGVGGFCAETTLNVERGKKARAASRESEVLYRQLFEHAGDYVLLLEIPPGKTPIIVDCNQAAAVKHGYTREELLGKPISFIDPASDKELVDRVRLAETGKIFDVTHRCRDGSTFAVEAVVRVLNIQGKKHQVSIERDVTERRRTERALRESDAKYRMLVEGTNDVVYSAAADGVLTYISPQVSRYGWSPEELIGRNFLGFIAEEDRERVAAEFEKTIREGKEQVSQFRVHRRKGGTFWVLDDGKAVRNWQGDIVGINGVLVDIDDRKRSEEALRAAALQKLESLGVMAGGIAHDFNNLLVGVEGNLSLLAAGLKGDRKREGLLRDIETACRKTKGLARQLLTFASGGGPTTRSEDLMPIVHETAVLLTRGSNVKCVFKSEEVPLWARADKAQISQVAQNLVLNAKQAMPKGGTITVGLSRAEVAAGAVPGLRAGAYVRITVKDHGAGIPKENLSRIFDPYFTTKGEGRGLGLAVCHSVVVKHGGHIDVESKPRTGTVFTVYLPAAQARRRAPAKAPAAPSELKGARVLIMDDDPDVGRVLKRLLVCLGSKASVVLDGRKALAAYRDARRSGKPFAVVVADLTVQGGMGGKEMLERMRKLDAQARVVVSSGYSNDSVMSDPHAHGFNGVLSKPYRLEDVSKVLGKVLKSP